MLQNNFWHPVNEKCGFILKDGTVINLENKHPHPNLGFLIPDSDIDQYKDDIAAIWHSHPSNDVNLSVEDYAAFLRYPDYDHHIYGLNHMAAYYVRGDTVYRR